ncbi:gamma-glutamylcyclotransferase [Actinokineospora sp. NBRC 105648]|uniref:gamma-glutamylcyclotransferase n=1 Tax=Actinokineospora sp. NBRC 105648 TaxID=3032206 RepID=UPI00255624CC|nr:gamma-glutamylcyclotransferase [Actinokineospora sp. NBRC 105648]
MTELIADAVSGPARDRVVNRIADHLLAHRPGHPLRVAVDGVAAAGKTAFARALVAAIEERGRPAVYLSTAGLRYRHAPGNYLNAYDFPAFASAVLLPLGPDGDRRYHPGVIDLDVDQPVEEPAAIAPDDAVAVVDGSFLQCEPLAALWDEVVYLDTDPALAPDAAEGANDPRPEPTHLRYLSKEEPLRRATILVGWDDVDSLVLRRIGGPQSATAQLFSYGTLRLPSVQVARFGRELVGVPDTLPGHRTDWVSVTDPAVIADSGTDKHPIVRPSADPADAVPGTVFKVTTTELAAADDYEVDDYRRVPVRLGSGATAWAYLDSAGT